MQIISNNTNFKINEPTVVAIGKFDGDHIGHQKIFSVMRQIRADEMLKISAFSFAFFNSPQISTLSEKRRLLENEGVDYLIEYPFDDDVKMMEAPDFIRDVLVGRLNMKHIVAGTDCSFGHNRSGNIDVLNHYAKQYGYRVTVIEKIRSGEEEISSSRIRKLISEGNVEDVAVLKGTPYTVSGIVEEGNKFGAKHLGFGTANIMPDNSKLFPKAGVYFTRTRLRDGSMHYSMTNIGTNPTIKKDSFGHIVRCETHIFDQKDTMYGQFIEIEFLKRIRDEQQFSSLDELVVQLKKDKQSCLSLIDYMKPKV